MGNGDEQGHDDASIMETDVDAEDDEQDEEEPDPLFVPGMAPPLGGGYDGGPPAAVAGGGGVVGGVAAPPLPMHMHGGGPGGWTGIKPTWLEYGGHRYIQMQSWWLPSQKQLRRREPSQSSIMQFVKNWNKFNEVEQMEMIQVCVRRWPLLVTRALEYMQDTRKKETAKRRIRQRGALEKQKRQQETEEQKRARLNKRRKVGVQQQPGKGDKADEADDEVDDMGSDSSSDEAEQSR